MQYITLLCISVLKSKITWHFWSSAFLSTFNWLINPWKNSSACCAHLALLSILELAKHITLRIHGQLDPFSISDVCSQITVILTLACFNLLKCFYKPFLSYILKAYCSKPGSVGIEFCVSNQVDLGSDKNTVACQAHPALVFSLRM